MSSCSTAHAVLLRKYGLNLNWAQCQRKNHAIPSFPFAWREGTDSRTDPGHHDVEKGRASLTPKSAVNENASASDAQAGSGWWSRRWKSVERTLVRYNLEARGIQRVLPDERHDMRQLGYIQIAILWFSVNLTANNLTLGMLYVSAATTCELSR